MTHWTIYCHTHIESGRRYIGMTKKTMLARWKDHCYAAKTTKGGRWHFPNAIRKYGKDAFSHEVLAVCWTLDDANWVEEHLIDRENTRNPEFGFNLAKGGSNTPHPIRRNPWNRPEYREKQLSRDYSHLQSPSAKAAAAIVRNTPEYRAKEVLTADHLQTPEIKAKALATQRSPEHKAKLAARPKSTHCKHGHSLENAYFISGRKFCRVCAARRAAKYNAKKMASEGSVL